jgi:hypothetical protein
MKNSILSLALSLAVIGTNAVPAPIPQAQTTSLPIPTRTFSTSGSLIGPTTLAGVDPSEPLSTQDTTLPIDEIDFAPGQEDDVDGVVLNFENITEPQPITGPDGGTDPGPRQNEIYRYLASGAFNL